jgi:prepilin-type N-terminal cleavage/methylation domain-containing protein
MNIVKKGFTLIELLVVVLIIGILAAIALPQYNAAVAYSRVAEALTFIKTLNQAQEIHHLTTGEYTINADNLDISLPSGFTLCASSDVRRLYSNGKTIIDLSKGYWGMGPSMTRNSACGWKEGASFSTNIVTRTPGYWSYCPETANAPCIECIVDKTGGNIAAQRKACERLGPYLGESETDSMTYVYSVSK